MRFNFGGASSLHGRHVLSGELARVSYVPKAEDGFEEYVLAFLQSVPTAAEEPELYADATQVDEQTYPGEVHLTYDGLRSKVILLTVEADNRFRNEHPEVVAQNELFTIDKEGK